MPFTIRQISSDDKFASQLTVDIFARVLPTTLIDQVLAETHRIEQRHRRLTMRTMVWLLIAMNIWTHCAIPTVYRHLTRGLRWIWPTEPLPPIPQSGAFTYRRYQLGVRPLHTLMRRICCPRATPTTPGDMATIQAMAGHRTYREIAGCLFPRRWARSQAITSSTIGRAATTMAPCSPYNEAQCCESDGVGNSIDKKPSVQ